MFKENDECCAIQCEKCGGTMYSDAASTSFICSFCGNKEPWPNSENILDSEIKYRHKPVEVINGLVKLGHVYFMEPLPEMLKNNTQSIEDKLGVFSALSTKVYEESHTIKLPCPLCGADVTGESTQTIFTCEYCGHRLTQEELKAGGYNKDQLIGAGSRSYPSIALPFKLTKEQAFGRAQLLMKREPMSFKGAEKAIKEKFTAFYTPYTLADLRVKAQISSNKGDCEIYQEVLNWVYPQTYVFDENAVDMVAPWNFDEFAPFDPVFLEGDVHITTRSNLFPVQKYLDRMINEQLCNRLSKNYGLQNVKIEKWARNLRKHSADIMLPIYYVDYTDNSAGERFVIVVNGQTGAASARFVNSKDKVRSLQLPASSKLPRFAETTLRTPPMIVRYVKPKFLHEVIPAEKGFKKSIFQMLKFW